MGTRVINVTAKKIKEQYYSSLEVTVGGIQSSQLHGSLLRGYIIALSHLPNYVLAALAWALSVCLGCFPAAAYAALFFRAV